MHSQILKKEVNNVLQVLSVGAAAISSILSYIVKIITVAENKRQLTASQCRGTKTASLQNLENRF